MTDVQEAVQTLLDALIHTDRERGVQVAAYLDGDLVVDAWAGQADPATGQPIDGNTLFTAFSATKGITATVIHLLAERGQLAYDEPVAAYWPEFAAHGKAGITVRHVLNHPAGVPQVPREIPVSDWAGQCRATAAVTPLWEPGTQIGYHALTFGTILGELAHCIDGRPIAQIVRDDIALPLGITSLYFGVPGETEHRVATLENDSSILRAAPVPADSLHAQALWPPLPEWASLYNRSAVRGAVIPAAGGIMTARGLARHYAALAGSGVDGVRLLPAERVRQATTLQPGGLDVVLRERRSRGLGYGLGGSNPAMSERASAFGHRGFGGSIGFADPEYGLAFALLKNRLAFSAPAESAAAHVARTVRSALGIPEA
jgi:CubicO group peptidase (beta-lactamase class C family)